MPNDEIANSIARDLLDKLSDRIADRHELRPQESLSEIVGNVLECDNILVHISPVIVSRRLDDDENRYAIDVEILYVDTRSRDDVMRVISRFIRRHNIDSESVYRYAPIVDVNSAYIALQTYGYYTNYYDLVLAKMLDVLKNKF